MSDEEEYEYGMLDDGFTSIYEQAFVLLCTSDI